MEFNCPTNAKHSMNITDIDDHFCEFTCVSCGSVVYKPIEYDQKPIVSDGKLLPESYDSVEEIQRDITDDKEMLDLLCSETTKYY